MPRLPVQYLCGDCLRKLVKAGQKSGRSLKGLRAMRGLAPHEDKTCFTCEKKARYVLVAADVKEIRKRVGSN